MIDPNGTSSRESAQHGDILGLSTKTGAFGASPDWQLPWYYKGIDRLFNLKVEVGGVTLLNIPKLLKNFKIGNDSFWQNYGFAKDVFGKVDDAMDVAETHNRVSYNQKSGVYGKSKEAQEANLGKYVTIMRAVEVATSWIPNTFNFFGNAMNKSKTFSKVTEKEAKRQGALIDMAVTDPSKDPEAFLDGLDRYNNSYR